MNGVCVLSISQFENWRYWITHTTVMLNTWPQNAHRTHTPRGFFLALITFWCLREIPYLPCSKSIQTYRSIQHKHQPLAGSGISTLIHQLHSIISFSSLIDVRDILSGERGCVSRGLGVFVTVSSDFQRVLIIRFVWKAQKPVICG